MKAFKPDIQMLKLVYGHVINHNQQQADKNLILMKTISKINLKNMKSFKDQKNGVAGDLFRTIMNFGKEMDSNYKIELHFKKKIN